MSSADPATTAVAVAAGDVLDSERAGPLALRGSVMRVGGYGGGMVLALASAPLLIRHLGQTGYGHYVTALTVATIFASLTEGGVNTIAVREFSTHSGGERARAMANMLGIRVLLSVAGVVVATVFAAAVGYSHTIVLGTAVAGVGLAIGLLQSLLSVPLQSQMRLGWVASADLLRNAVTTVLVIAFVLLGAGLVPLLAVLIPGCLAALILTVVLIRGTMSLRPALRFSEYAPLLRETLPFAIAIALSSLYFRLTVIVMSLEDPGKPTGYFSTSFRIVEILISLPTLVIGAAFPIVTRAQRDDPERFAHAARRMFELSVLVGIWVAMSLELGAGFAVSVLGGHGAGPAGPVLQIQGLAVMGTFVSVACSFPLLSLRRYTILLYLNVLGLVVTFAVALPLVPVLHARGAAIATVAAELALAAAAALALVRARPDVRLPLGILPLTLAAGGAGLAVGHLVGIHPIVEVLAGTVVYAVVLKLFGRFPPEIGHALRAGRAGRAAPVAD